LNKLAIDSTVLLTLAGHAPSDELLQWRSEEAELTVAVDGGWLVHRSAELEPDVILGDFDSCGELSEIEKIFPRSALHHLSDQNHTDFEKALDWIKPMGQPKKLVILGGLGKRMDHTLSNLMIAGRVDSRIEVIFDDVHEYVSRITPETPLHLTGRSGANLSILPMGKCEGVQSSGLEWELEDLCFSWDRMISQSNRCLTDDVSVSCETGVLYGFVPKDA
jgi:thiamine pyrophosphokinase